MDCPDLFAGGTCRRVLAAGIGFMSDMTAGRRRASGRADAVADPDFATLFVDGRIVRVHQHGVGRKKTANGKQPGWPDDQDTRWRGYAGQSRPASSERRAGV